jgi:hypothetical protein
MGSMTRWFRKLGLFSAAFALMALLFTSSVGCVVRTDSGRSSQGLKRGHNKPHPGKKKGHAKQKDNPGKKKGHSNATPASSGKSGNSAKKSGPSNKRK